MIVPPIPTLTIQLLYCLSITYLKMMKIVALAALAGSAAAFAPSSTKVCLSLFTWVGKELGFVDWLVIQVFDF